MKREDVERKVSEVRLKRELARISAARAYTDLLKQQTRMRRMMRVASDAVGVDPHHGARVFRSSIVTTIRILIHLKVVMKLTSCFDSLAKYLKPKDVEKWAELTQGVIDHLQKGAATATEHADQLRETNSEMRELLFKSAV